MSGFVYAIAAGDQVKIGWSTNPAKRRDQIQIGNGLECRLIGCVPATIDQECEAHQLLSAWRVTGEWFQASAPAVAAFCSMLQPPPVRRLVHVREPANGFAALLKAKDVPLSEFARAVGVSRQNVSRWALGRVVPRPAEMQRIIEATNGALSHADFYPLAKQGTA